ncbi:hypothetical protein [Amycolatopsis pigmentata]|uniref:Uncharacterized protein n=1 Tax=Amycolatopsis pigmentata TaxID=450801 RepID=A0ABW5FV30_9PSEU
MTTPSSEDYGPVEPVPVKRKKPKRTLIVTGAGAFIVVVILALTLPSLLKPKTFRLNGAMTVMCSTTYGTYSSSNCAGYSDLRPGAQVVVYNEKQEILATGTLVKAADPTATTSSSRSVSDSTIYQFSIADVPRGEKQYGVHIGNSNRGVIWKNEQEASTDGFLLSIGGN